MKPNQAVQSKLTEPAAETACKVSANKLVTSDTPATKPKNPGRVTAGYQLVKHNRKARKAKKTSQSGKTK